MRKMKCTIWCVVGLLFFTSAIFAQISPHPVLEAEIRDNTSIRMRSMQLERVKRESTEVVSEEPSKERLVKLAEIKEDFENIQKLQNEIVKAYTTGKKINFEKIDDS